MWPHVTGTKESTNHSVHFHGLRNGMDKEMTALSLGRFEYLIGIQRATKEDDSECGTLCWLGPVMSPVDLCSFVLL